MFQCLRHTALRQARAELQSVRPISRAQQTILSRLLSTLTILEQREGKLQPQSLSAVTAAQKLGGSIVGFIAGSNVKPVAEEAAKVNGVEKILIVENAAYDKVESQLSWKGPFLHAAGFTRKLCTSPCRKHQERGIYTRYCQTLGLR
jgi:hypothetical protein